MFSIYAVNLHTLSVYSQLHADGDIIRRVMVRGAGGGSLRRFLLPKPVGHFSGDVLLAGKRVLHGFPHIGDGR